MPHRLIKVPLSRQAIHLLEQMARTGLYGVNKEEVAGRLIDKALLDLLGEPPLKLKLPTFT